MTDTLLKQAVLLMSTVALSPLNGCGTPIEPTNAPQNALTQRVNTDERLEGILLPLPDEATYFYRQRLQKHNREHPTDTLEALSENTLICYLDRHVAAAKAQGKEYDSATDAAFINAVHRLGDMWHRQQELVKEQDRLQEIEINTAAFAARVVDGFWMPETPDQTAEQYHASFERAKKENPALKSLESIAATDIEEMGHHLAYMVCRTNPYVAERCRETVLRIHAEFEAERTSLKTARQQVPFAQAVHTPNTR